MEKLYLVYTICHNSDLFRIYLGHLQGVNEHKYSLYKKADGL